jgi:hypothetical protein
MPENALSIVNRALQRLAVEPITALNCTTVNAAVVMCTLYEPTLRAKQQEHRWNFTTIRAELAGWACSPVHTFGCAYVLPGDLLQIDETDLDEDEPWRVESHYCSVNATYTNVLVTDGCSPVGIVYTAYVTHEARWSPQFTEAFVVELAAQAAYPLRRDSNLQDVLAKEAEKKWAKARSRDGQAGRPLERWLSNTLIRARFGGYTSRDPTRLNW